MKKLLYTVFSVVALMAAGCSSDDGSSSSNNNDGNNNDNPVEVDAFLNYTLNGTEDVETSPSTAILGPMLVRGDFHSGNIHHSVSLWMPVDITVGTHPFEEATAENQDVYSASVWVGSEIVDATEGALVITNITADYFEGTFSFSGTTENGTTGTVTNGTFRANL